MKAVFSYWDPTSNVKNSGGFNNFRDLLASTALAVCTAKQYFDKIEFVTNDFGERHFIEKLKLPFTSVKLDFNGLETKIKPIFWGFSKIIAYNLQEEPFIHFDNDVFIWSGIPKDLQQHPLFFQSEECILGGERHEYDLYKGLIKLFSEKAPHKPRVIVENPTDIAYNCGIVGCNDLEIIKEWFKTSSEYVFAPENQKFFEDKRNMLIHQNLLQEQYFIGCIVRKNKINVGVLLNDLQPIKWRLGLRYSHIWGLVKREEKVMVRVYNRLQKDHPDIYKRVMEYDIHT